MASYPPQRTAWSAAGLAAAKMLGMYDALFVQLAQELGLPLLTSDAKLSRAVSGTASVEVLRPSTR